MSGRNLLLILVGLIVATFLALLFFNENGHVFGLKEDQFGYLGYFSILAVAVLSGLTLRNARFSKLLKDAAIWIIVAAALVIGYALKDDIAPIGQRFLATLIPGTPASLEGGFVQITRGRSGEFTLKASANGVPVTFLFDTGASAVVLTYEDAERAGFSPENLTFGVSVDTANGRTTAAPITIGMIEIGSIKRQKVRGLIANKGDLSNSLLGMTFMNTLSSFSVRGDILELKD